MRFVDYEETNHVRMYQFADHPEWLALSPEARCVYALLRMHVQEDGSIPIGYGAPETALSRLLRLDVEFVATALEELLDPDRRHLLWNQALGELTDPAHAEGEKAAWSSSFRKKRYRERKEAADSRKRRLKHANVAAFPSASERSAGGTQRSEGNAAFQKREQRVPQAERRVPEMGTPRSPEGTARSSGGTPRSNFGYAAFPERERRVPDGTPRSENGYAAFQKGERRVPEMGTPRSSDPHTVVVGSCSVVEQQTTTSTATTTTATEGALARAAPEEQEDPAFEEYRGRLSALIERVWRRSPKKGEVRTMRQWFDRGVDIDFLLGSLWEEFQEVEADGQILIELPRDSEDDPVMYLSFFRAKMLNAWRKVEVLQAPARAVEMPPPVNVPLRLVQIVDALPERLPERERFAEEILGLEGEPLDDVEDRLEEIETEVLRALHEALEPDEGAELVERLNSSYSVLAGRLPERERERARRRIYRQLLVEWFGVPGFSLF